MLGPGSLGTSASERGGDAGPGSGGLCLRVPGGSGLLLPAGPWLPGLREPRQCGIGRRFYRSRALRLERLQPLDPRPLLLPFLLAPGVGITSVVV